MSVSTTKIKNNEKPICATCQGACCKRYAGIISPEQVVPFTKERIIQMVIEEGYCFDDWSGDPRYTINYNFDIIKTFKSSVVKSDLDDMYKQTSNEYPEIPRQDNVFFLRPRHLNPTTGLTSRKIYDPSYGGVCSFLKVDNTGCKLSFDNRPLGCQTLKVNAEIVDGKLVTNCKGIKGYSKKDFALMWLPHYKLLHEVYKHIE